MNKLKFEYSTTAQQTAIIEFHIINDFICDQLRMPMVSDGLGGEAVRSYFQKMVVEMANTLIQEEYMPEDFSVKWQKFLYSGSDPEIPLSLHKIYQLAYDTAYVLSSALDEAGYPLAIGKEDSYYNNEEYWETRSER